MIEGGSEAKRGTTYKHNYLQRRGCVLAVHAGTSHEIFSGEDTVMLMRSAAVRYPEWTTNAMCHSRRK